jgi:hypothetical protein
MIPSERQKAAERLARELHALGCETQPRDDKLRIRFPESPRRRVIQLLRDEGYDSTFIGMTPRLCVASGVMPLWFVWEINLDRQPGDHVAPPAEPQPQPESTAGALMEKA